MLFVYFIVLVLLLSGVILSLSERAKAKAQREREAEVKQNAEKEIQHQMEAEKHAFDDKWQVLANYDDDVRHACELVLPHGDAAIAELKQVYKVIGDKSKLSQAASRIAADFASGLRLIPAPEPESEEYNGQSIKLIGSNDFLVGGKSFASLKEAKAHIDMMKWTG
jgi:hypothetical protein